MSEKDPEVGQEQAVSTGLPVNGPTGAKGGVNTGGAKTWLTKTNLMIAGALAFAIVAFGIGVGVPIRASNSTAAASGSGNQNTLDNGDSTTDAPTTNSTQTETGGNATGGDDTDPTVKEQDGNEGEEDEAETETQEPDVAIKGEGPFVSQVNSFRFGSELQPISRNIMAGYGSCSDLLVDVQSALEALANEQIESGRDMKCWWNPNGPYRPPPPSDTEDRYYPCMEAMAFDKSESDSATTSNRVAEPTSTEDSYGTNNQVEGVDEADLVKSNGRVVFMGYGSEVIVIDLDGNILDRVEVPLPPNAVQLKPGFEEATSGGDSTTSRRSFGPGGWGCGPPKPQYRKVKALLMKEEMEADGVTPTGDVTLNVITTFDDWTCESSMCGGLTTSFIYKFDGSDTGNKKLYLFASQDVNGRYNNARSIKSINHLVTDASIQTWAFTGPLYRCDQTHYWNTTYEEYEELAYQKANETVRQYAEDIVAGLSWATVNGTADDACRHIVQISSMTSGDNGLSAQEKRSLRFFSGQGVLRNFVQITSLDLDQLVDPDTNGPSRNETLGTGLGTVASNVAGAFIAQYDPELYATQTDLILAGRGWRYDNNGRWDEYTYLMSFDLADNAVFGAVPKAIGEVTGYLKNQFSMDHWNDHLRVATTSFQKWDRVFDEKTNETKWMVVTNSTSQVTVLKDNDAGELEEVGFVGNLGPSEDIKSVRFLSDRGYVVTFRTVDPLYSLDLTNPTDPRVEGELKITGFSEYMHPISDIDDPTTKSGDFLLTVGKEADEEQNGRVIGTKISVFDVRDITKPTLVGDYVILNGENGWSNSAASYDHYAFRYMPQSKKLIIPLSKHDWENRDNNFDGFVIYNIDIANKAISMTGNVTHSEGENTYRWCWSMASLKSRSMAFGGNLMTFKSHSIKFTMDVNNLSGDVWDFGEINLDANRTKSNECHSYGPWFRW